MIKLVIYDLANAFNQNYRGPIFRSIGQYLNRQGLSLQGSLASDDGLVPSLRCREYSGSIPSLEESSFIAPNSVVVGDVKIGDNSSIWYGTSLRGDGGKISIGNGSVVQDRASIVPSLGQTSIGDNVFVGCNSYLESCTLENNSFVGFGSSIKNNATVQSFAVIAAGSVVGDGVNVPSNQIWAGNPAQYLRDITPEERQVIQEHQSESVQLAKIHAEETEKTFRQIINDKDIKQTEMQFTEEQSAVKAIKDLGLPTEFDDEDYIEQRVFMKEPNEPTHSYMNKQNYEPYEQDLFHFPDSFKKYGENYDKYDSVKKYFEENPNVEAKVILNNDTELPTDVEHRDKSHWSKKY